MLITDNKKISKAIRITYFDKNKSSLDDVEMAIASRAFAKLLLAESRKKLKVIQLTSAGFVHKNTLTKPQKAALKCDEPKNTMVIPNIAFDTFTRKKRIINWADSPIPF